MHLQHILWFSPQDLMAPMAYLLVLDQSPKTKNEIIGISSMQRRLRGVLNSIRPSLIASLTSRNTIGSLLVTAQIPTVPGTHITSPLQMCKKYPIFQMHI